MQPTDDERVDIAGLWTRVIRPETDTRLVVVLLHGYGMRSDDLSPFAHSMRLGARFLVPDGPVAVASTDARAWWPIDEQKRSREVAAGPRDLYKERPPGAAAARAAMLSFLDRVQSLYGPCPVVLVGFSQGGMLACDLVLRDEPAIAGLALLSASRITGDDWAAFAQRVRGLPIFVSHGRQDPDLSFTAGEALRDLLISGGAQVAWEAHDLGHQIPLVVWRRLRKFLAAFC